MSVVHQQVAAKRAGSVVVDAAGPVRDVAHDERLRPGAEGCHDVGDERREQQKSFGKLQRYIACGERADAVDRLVELEGVVGREVCNSGVEGGVLEDGGRDLVEGASGAGLPRRCIDGAAISGRHP